MITTRLQTTTRRSSPRWASPPWSFGLVGCARRGRRRARNCVDVPVAQSGPRRLLREGLGGRRPGPDDVLEHELQGRARHETLDAFYVIAPQTDAPQGAPPNTFAHDHVVRDVPAQNHGSLQRPAAGLLRPVQRPGIVSGACVPTWTSVGGPIRSRSRRRSTASR